MKRLLLAALGLAGALASPAHARESVPLLSDWKFLRHEIAPDEKNDGWKNPTVPPWENVTVPHTWNTKDGANGLAANPDLPEGYYRGPAWYVRDLPVPGEWKGRRVFIRFEGVSQIADVFVNRRHVGQHRGAFGAFCFEITPFLKFDGKDGVRVRADNARAFDVAPLSGDFTVFGGIYRPVEMFATGEVCISPLFFGSPGTFLTVRSLGEKEAVVEVKTKLSGAGAATSCVSLATEVRDAEGAVVASSTDEVAVAPGTEDFHLQTLRIPSPHLWNGQSDPYLYSAKVRVMRGDEVLDEVTQPLGLRTVALDGEKGFLLNGKPYELHGVNRHQDRDGKGWALSAEEHEEDHALIREMGANTIRLAHYQQAAYFHDLSDRHGMITWEEIPLVDAVSASPQFLENARQQLQEMVWQDYNHPSVAMWGLYHELECGATTTAPPVPIVENLQALAKEIDPTRPTVAASFRQDASARHKIPDHAAWNIYPGWYSASPDDAGAWIEKYRGQMGKRIGISEYGAGANPAQGSEASLTRPEPDGEFHPPEWQNHFHELLWGQLKGNPNLWGTWIWSMFDFAVDSRDEGGIPGLNDKGVVTRDRRTKKDTFYFYKANWSTEPVVRITSRALTPRKQTPTAVKVYSNCPQVELLVNGVSVGATKPDEFKICRWENVSLRPGPNRLEAVGQSGATPVRDSCQWTLD